MASPKEAGGLGIKKIKVMNDCLLLKWWWRYGHEGKSLWRKVLSAKYGVGNSALLPNVNGVGRFSWIWADIVQVGSRQTQIASYFNDNVEVRVGNGRTALFWYDRWLGGRVLKDVFPKLFMLSINKNCAISSLCNLNECQIRWGINFRRELRSWEVERLEELNGLLDSFHFFREETNDTLIWKGSDTQGKLSI